MVKMDHRNDKGGYSLLRDYHSLLELRLLELANSRFVWKGKNSFSFNRCFLVIEGGGRMINHSGNQELELRQNHAYFVPPRAEISCDFQPGISLLSLHFQLYILPGVEVFGGELLCREAAVDPERLREFAGLMARTPDWEVFCRFEDVSPAFNETCPVALCPWTPHCRSFRAVEHAELDGSFVGDDSHLSA